jgi:hypothetical protein
VKAPKDKGHVERHVRIVEDDIIRPMNSLDIHSLSEFNTIMKMKLIDRNARDYSKKMGSRLSIFENEEKDTLLPLPVQNFQTYDKKEATVWRDFHIQYDSAFYSVPVQYVGQKVTVKATTDTVRIYSGEKLIAEHKRAVRKWQRLTQKEHIPGKGIDLHGAYSSEELLLWAEKFGPFTVKWVTIELGRFEYEVQSYRPITSVLRILNKYGAETAENASEAALAAGIFTVKGYKNILGAQVKSNSTNTNQMDLNDIFCSHDEWDGSK